MNYQQFVIVVKEKVAQSLQEGMTLQIHTALKNNGRERVGLTISNPHVNIAPTIYLEEYFEQFQAGISIDWIIENILDLYHEVKFKHDWDIHSLKDFEDIREKIVYKIIHAEKNETLLQTLPYITYLDFAIVFYILFEVNETGTATVPITHQLLRLWDKSLDEIQHAALQNTPCLLPASFKSMNVVIEELLGHNCGFEDSGDETMYVLTNYLRSFGASCILYDGILEKIGNEIEENYYVLPSSVHEMIIIPESKSPSREHLTEMIREVNKTQVAEEEVLSDQIYYYDRRTKSIT